MRRLWLVLVVLVVGSCGVAPRAGGIRSGGDLPVGWVELTNHGWTLRVPSEWSPGADLRAQRFSSLTLTVPPGTRTMDLVYPFWHRMAVPPEVVADRMREGPELALTVAKFRDELPLQRATDAYVDMECCLNADHAPAAHVMYRKRLDVEVDGAAATLTKVLRTDGAREWYLIVGASCSIFVVRLVVRPDRVGLLRDKIDRVLASFRFDDEGGPGECPS